VKENLEAISQETSRGADLRAFREFTKICVAHDEALWNECTKPQWARLRMNLYCGKQRAFANVLNQTSALKGGQESEACNSIQSRAQGVQKRSIPAPPTRASKKCAHRFVTIPIDQFRTSYTHHELGCTLQRVEMVKCQRSHKDIENA